MTQRPLLDPSVSKPETANFKFVFIYKLAQIDGLTCTEGDKSIFYLFFISPFVTAHARVSRGFIGAIYMYMFHGRRFETNIRSPYFVNIHI